MGLIDQNPESPDIRFHNNPTEYPLLYCQLQNI